MYQISIKWSTEDVLMKAEEMGYNISEDVADTILDSIEHHHDANIGINWDVIAYHIENHAPYTTNKTTKR